jgi:anthranilate/para-aminobenzoate synthase component I
MLLLDDVESSREQPSSRLYQHVKQRWQANRVSELASCFTGIESALAKGDYVVALFAYELGYYFQNIPCKYPEPLPLVRAWSFGDISKHSKEDIDQLLKDLFRSQDPVAGVLDLKDSIDASRFAKDIQSIQEWIRAGDTYQINHTYRITGNAYGSPLALYARLRERQPGRYGAFIQDGDECVLSQSI